MIVAHTAAGEMIRDLSEIHGPLGALGDRAAAALTPDQLAFFHENGYLAGVRILDDAQIETLRDELARLIDPAHPGHDLFYEFHSNESTTPGSVLFHALGAWRIEPGFHDILWHPAFVTP